jgi:hypothetical protein
MNGSSKKASPKRNTITWSKLPEQPRRRTEDNRKRKPVLTVSPLANTLGFVPLPPLYWLYLAVMLLAYAILTQVVKSCFIRRFGE